MKILVAVKQVTTVDDEFEIDGLTIDSRYVGTALNEWDEYAIEEAVQIGEEHDADVVSVTIGPESTDETIRQALAKGVDRAVRVWDDSLADAGLLGPATKARLLGAVADDEDPDLVLTGVQSGDDSFAATGVALAERLGFGWAAVVNELTVDADAGELHVHRELEGGVDELTELTMPAVLTIQTGINDPRYASLRGIRQAQEKELAVKSLSDLGLGEEDLDSSLVQTDLYEPTVEHEPELFVGSPEETAGELAAVFRQKGVGQ